MKPTRTKADPAMTGGPPARKCPPPTKGTSSHKLPHRKPSRNDDLHRLLPQSPDAEKAFIASCLLMPELLDDCGTKPEHMHTPAHQIILAAMFDLRREAKPVDLLTVSLLLEDSGKLSEAGGAANVTDISGQAITPDNATYFAEIISEKATLRQIVKTCTEYVTRSHDEQGNIPELITGLLESVTDIAQKYGGRSRNKLPPARHLVDFNDLEIDSSKTLLGDRWLCRGGGALFVGPSGIGKSSASVQQDVLWGVGKPAFGIVPAGPLRILCIQAEDDEGDISEMVTGVVRGLEIRPDELASIRDRVFYVSEKSRTGTAFLQSIVRPLLAKYKPDLLRINPLLAYLGGDPSDPKATAEFLRSGLNPLLEEFQCAAIIAHHTPKVTNRDTSNWRGSDWMYSGAGSADITNWARAALVIDPTHAEHVFRFIAAKRGRRLSWEDDNGIRITSRHFCHDTNGSMFWRDAKPDEIPHAGSAGKVCAAATKSAADLLPLIPIEGAIPKEVLIAKARSAGIGDAKARSFLAELTETGDLFIWRVKRPGTNAQVQISRREQVLI